MLKNQFMKMGRSDGGKWEGLVVENGEVGKELKL